MSYSIKNTPPSSSSNALWSGMPLRILPLGDSITYGFDMNAWGATNGYRQPLLDLLSNNTVDYIGSMESGNMLKNRTEGHSGARIELIAQWANVSLWEMPNVVLLMAGTNDVLATYWAEPPEPELLSLAPGRLGNLIDQIFDAVPETTLIVAGITAFKNATFQAGGLIFNAQIPGVVAERANAGKHVLTIDMMDYVPAADTGDGVHPNQTGYALMAQGWYTGLQQAASNGWIVEAQTPYNETTATATAIGTPTSTATSSPSALSVLHASSKGSHVAQSYWTWMGPLILWLLAMAMS
jgi:lysophospholipase L1-like esterase